MNRHSCCGPSPRTASSVFLSSTDSLACVRQRYPISMGLPHRNVARWLYRRRFAHGHLRPSRKTMPSMHVPPHRIRHDPPQRNITLSAGANGYHCRRGRLVHTNLARVRLSQRLMLDLAFFHRRSRFAVVTLPAACGAVCARRLTSQHGVLRPANETADAIDTRSQHMVRVRRAQRAAPHAGRPKDAIVVPQGVTNVSNGPGFGLAAGGGQAPTERCVPLLHPPPPTRPWFAPRARGAERHCAR